MSRAPRRRLARRAGFTIIEMLVVVLIIAILATLAVVSVSGKPRTIDAANRVADLMREASRMAVSLGRVRPDVQLVAGGTRARTRIVATTNGAGAVRPTKFTLQRLVEGATAGTFSWSDVQSYTTPTSINGNFWTSVVNNVASATQNADINTFTANCYPDGTCDPRTVCLYWYNYAAPSQAPALNGSVYAYASLMPLGGSVRVATTAP